MTSRSRTGVLDLNVCFLRETPVVNKLKISSFCEGDYFLHTVVASNPNAMLFHYALAINQESTIMEGNVGCDRPKCDLPVLCRPWP